MATIPVLLLYLFLLAPGAVSMQYSHGSLVLGMPYSDAALVLGVTVYDACGRVHHLAITPLTAGTPPAWARITTERITAEYRLNLSCPPAWVYLPTGLVCNSFLCLPAEPERFNRTWLRYTLSYPLLRYINKTTTRFLRSVIPGNITTLPRPHDFWALAEWSYSHFFYDLDRMREDVPVYTPEEFYRHGGGMCSDYSLFMAAAAVALGYTRVAVLVVDTGSSWHAVPGIWYNGTFYVTDFQPYLVDYRLYVPWWASSQSVIRRAYLYMLELNGSGRVLTIRGADLGGQPHELDRRLVAAVCRTLARVLGAQCGRTAGMRVIGDTGSYITRFYSPVFRDEWASYYARLIATSASGPRPAMVYVAVRGHDIIAFAYP